MGLKVAAVLAVTLALGVEAVTLRQQVLLITPLLVQVVAALAAVITTATEATAAAVSVF
jgi:high-affinity Fe2+/Pb2+ permease